MNPKPKPRKLIPETAAKRLLSGDVEMLAAALSHGLDGSEVWPDTHLPVAMGLLWHCPERIAEMLEVLHDKGVLEINGFPVQVEAFVAGCWRVHPEAIDNRLQAMKWLVEKSGPSSGQRMVEASIGAGFVPGVALFWDYLSKDNHIACLQMALVTEDLDILLLMQGKGIKIDDPLVHTKVVKRSHENQKEKSARLNQLVMRANVEQVQSPAQTSAIPRI